MPTLLTIPREIRDEIYTWSLSLPLPPQSRDRKRISHDPSDPDTHAGEHCVRYPLHIPLPPSHGILSSSRQLRQEFLGAIKRISCVRYKVDIVDRKTKGILAPTWKSVPCLPCFVDKIDVLEVQWRLRSSRTSSVANCVEDDEREKGPWSTFEASLVMLQRFVERGVYLLSKKKREKIHIGCLEIRLDTASEMTSEAELASFVQEIGDFLDVWMVGDVPWGSDEEDKERDDEQFRMLAGKIDRVTLHANGGLKREWVISEMVTKRDEAERLRMAELEDGGEER
ncbi:hypothetical protein BDZ45DRAFT_669679 [Acephala macrosclerotiorum]|nr:hypothetical protein BDZ45DRAFT_669679 [Acephala macrosclerotiorum]